MKVENWKKVINKNLPAGSTMDLVSGDNISMAKFIITKPGILSKHSHPNEQVSYVLKGKMKLICSDQETVMSAGDIKIILANELHSAEIIEVPFESIDVFSPIRKDFLEQLGNNE